MKILFAGAFLVTLAPLQLTKDPKPQFIIWNVGQGQWLTYKNLNFCLHIDMGGENYPGVKVYKECLQRKNYLALSHPDWDHISFIKRYKRLATTLCLVYPLTDIFSKKELRNLVQLPLCSNTNELQKIVSRLSYPLNSKKQLSTNSKSQILTIASTILIPGDSTQTDEKIWADQIPLSNNINYLILGHHGSRTSTSLYLLSKLPNLKQAIASSRKKRFGHPHPKTKYILQKKKTPLITTESQGHIYLWL